MRFYVRACSQSALFRRLRFSSPGQTSSRLTEKRSLRLWRHQKAHSVCRQSRTLRLSVRRDHRMWFYVRPNVQSALFRHVAQPRVRFYVRSNAQSALFRRMRFSSPGQMSSQLTEKRSLRLWRHQKAHSAAASHQKAHSVCGQSHTMRLAVRRDRRMWFYVRSNARNAVLREPPGAECAFP